MKRRSLKWIVPALLLMSVTIGVQAQTQGRFLYTGNKLVEFMGPFDKMMAGDCRDNKC